MKRFEYTKIHKIDIGIFTLGDMGKKGWELVSIDGSWYIFKREIEGKED